MKDTTRGEDILSEVKKTLVKFELPEKKLCGVTTDGAKQLCAKVLEMKNVMELVIHTVNFIRSRGLNHRQFKQLLEGCVSEAEDVIYFSQVRWLSRAATLKRFWILLPEIVLFLKIKGKNTSLLENIDCLNDLAFLIDMTQMLMELNLKLQGKDQLISKFSKVLVHFKALSERNDEFDTRFCDFKKEKNELDLFAHSFSIKAETVRNEFQMELIELQNNKDLKEAYKEVELLEFYKKYMSKEMVFHFELTLRAQCDFLRRIGDNSSIVNHGCFLEDGLFAIRGMN
ncbi:general transcription factor II-I repeat domain-containing protein 2A-like [Hydra vulgaris]|uniref:General transcription factor II-I repeat domain-containing protein 2A-like n=1 Tax=Hydra vulgaris TaxID=6087 RepID=A0ABM4C074_HYDVU